LWNASLLKNSLAALTRERLKSWGDSTKAFSGSGNGVLSCEVYFAKFVTDYGQCLNATAKRR